MSRKKRDLTDEFRRQLEENAVMEANRAIEHLNRCYTSPVHSRSEAAKAFQRAVEYANIASRLAGEI